MYVPVRVRRQAMPYRRSRGGKEVSKYCRNHVGCSQTKDASELRELGEHENGMTTFAYFLPCPYVTDRLCVIRVSLTYQC